MTENYQQKIEESKLEDAMLKDYLIIQKAKSSKTNLVYEYLQSLPEDSIYRRNADLYLEDDNYMDEMTNPYISYSPDLEMENYDN